MQIRDQGIAELPLFSFYPLKIVSSIFFYEKLFRNSFELSQVGLTFQSIPIRRKIPGASEHRSIASPHGTAVHCRRPFFRSSATLSRRIAHTPYGRQELVVFFLSSVCPNRQSVMSQRMRATLNAYIILYRTRHRPCLVLYARMGLTRVLTVVFFSHFALHFFWIL